MRRTLSRCFVLSLAAIAVVGCEPRPPQVPPTPKTADAAALSPASLQAFQAASPQAASPSISAVVPPAVVPPDFSVLVARVGTAVVNVTTRGVRGGEGDAAAQESDPLPEFLRRFKPHGAPPQEELPSRGIGTGFIIDAQGYVLTNAHVVAGADQVTVRLPGSKREHKAQVIGLDRKTDVGLLKVEAGNLPVVALGDSDKLKTGEWVAAIGSPFGFANTITAGIVSAKERLLPDEIYVPFIQTDVAVNPGNSGGPLLNTRGEVVGINSQIYSPTGGYLGVSFAIPIDVAMDVAQQLRADGHVTRGRLGVSLQEVSSQLAQSFKLNEARGALVTAVERGGPAEKAGLAPGDVILRFAGKEIVDVADLPRLLARAKPGSAADIEVWRDGERRALSATVAAEPTPRETKRLSSVNEAPEPGSAGLGLALRELPQHARHALGVDYGLMIEGLAGPNAETPLQRGDIVIAVNNQRFNSLEEFKQQVDSTAPAETVALLVRRGDSTVYVPVTVSRPTRQ